MEGNMKIFALAGAALLAFGTLALAPTAVSAAAFGAATAVQSATADSNTLKVDVATKKKKKAKPIARPRKAN
jgi:hypothetical protein